MTSTAAARGSVLGFALRLEYATVVWNVIEGIVAVAAALAAGSVALLGFGVDSFVETISGSVLIWRLRAERRAHDEKAIEQLDRRAHQLVGISLFLLAGYIALEAGHAIWAQEQPDPSWIGIAVTSISVGVMWWLARAKRNAATALGSRALAADSFQTSACFWLSVITLSGIGLNALLGWWWADPAAAIAMTPLLVREGREAWRGEDCCRD